MIKQVDAKDAPQGAILTEKDLRTHLSQGLPLWEGICGRVREFEYDAGWAIGGHSLMGGSIKFLYPSSQAEKNQTGCSLRDRHINGGGWNDNWWFSSEEAARSYAADRVKA